MANIPSKSNDHKYYLFALRIIGDFGATIAIPAVLAAWMGGKLDSHYQRYPLFTAICLFIAFVLTMMLVKKKAYKYGQEYNKL